MVPSERMAVALHNSHALPSSIQRQRSSCGPLASTSSRFSVSAVVDAACPDSPACGRRRRYAAPPPAPPIAPPMPPSRLLSLLLRLLPLVCTARATAKGRRTPINTCCMVNTAMHSAWARSASLPTLKSAPRQACRATVACGRHQSTCVQSSAGPCNAAGTVLSPLADHPQWAALTYNLQPCWKPTPRTLTANVRHNGRHAVKGRPHAVQPLARERL